MGSQDPPRPLGSCKSSQAYPRSSAAVLEPPKKCAPGTCTCRELKRELVPSTVRILGLFTSTHYFEKCHEKRMKRMRVIVTYICKVCHEVIRSRQEVAYCEVCTAEDPTSPRTPLVVRE